MNKISCHSHERFVPRVEAMETSFFHSYMSNYREDICLQTLLLLLKCTNHRNKRPFVSTTNEALVGTLMTIGDINDIFPIHLSYLYTVIPIALKR